ncbi:MAG TPA: DUF5655 domain-containing protein [Thermoanaerobaculia bacterium]|nr:DUF5655 domain-containing protein [Thermoanaerobaculia bacterium]
MTPTRKAAAARQSRACPACGREFPKANQWHSCAVKALDEHFRGRDPELREIFDELVRRLRRLGPIKVDPVKTSINLTARHHLGAVTVRGSFLRLGFLAEKRIEDARIVHFERLGPAKFGHSVILESIEDLDPVVMGWLAAAYRLRS